MKSISREHAGAGIVALATVTAAVFDGAFSPSAFALLAALTWAAVITGILGRVLPTGPVGLPAVAGGAALAAVMLLSGASVLWASDQGRAFEEAVRVSAYLGLFVLAACTAGPGGRRQWLNGLTLGLGAVSVLALFSYVQPQVLQPEDTGIPNAAGRLSYPLGYWNAVAALLACASVLLADAAVRLRARGVRTLAAALLAPTLLGIWLTASRGALVAALVALLVLVLLSPRRERLLTVLLVAGAGAVTLILVAEQMDALLAGETGGDARGEGDALALVVCGVVAVCGLVAWRLDRVELRVPRPRRRVVLAVAVLACAGVAALAVAADPEERFEQFKEPPPALASGEGLTREANSSGRWQFWSEALSAFASQPVAGIGAGAYESWWAEHAPIPLLVRNPHSLPLQQLAELGAVGIALLLTFLAALVVSIRNALTRTRRAETAPLVGIVVAAGLAACVDWTWQFPAAIGPAVIGAALLMASAPGRALAPRAAGIALVTLVLGVASLAAAGSVGLTELRLEQSRDAAAEGRLALATERAREARASQPWSPKPYLQLALLEQAEGDYGRALAYLDQAGDRDESDWRLALLRVAILVEAGDMKGAKDAVRRVPELTPIPVPQAGEESR
jgi:O-antigen ligase